jgi:Ca2+-binding RTX toxin-like protein
MATLTGKVGAETLIGGTENDLINGGAGNDTLYGGAGDDTLHGGSDAVGSYNPQYQSVNGASQTVTGSNGRANFTASSTSGDGELTQYNFYGVNGVWIGNGDSTETHSHTMSSQVAGARIPFNAVNTTDVFSITLDGVAVNLNSAIANGSVSFSGGTSYGINASGGIVGLTKGDALATGVLTINVPFTKIGFANTGSGNGTVYDLQVNTNPLSGIFAGGDDALYGGDGNDLIYTDTGNDTVEGGTGNDKVYGGTGQDLEYGGTGDDTMLGEAGNDLLYGGDGRDSLSGGDGNDLVSGEAGADTLEAEAGNDTAYGGADNDALYGGAGEDLLYAGSGDDSALGGDGNDSLYGEDGNDLIDGGAGNDLVYGGSGNDQIGGGDGADSLFGDAGRDLVDGGAGADWLYGGADADTLSGGADNDQLFGGAGDDSAAGGDGADQLSGEDGNDALDGGAGADTLFGGTGADALRGGAGDDQILGGEDADRIVITSGDGSDVVVGGEKGDDHDRLDFSENAKEGVSLTFKGDEAGSYSLGGSARGSFAEIEEVAGSQLDDHIDASASGSSQSLYGGGGNDVLVGGSGRDVIEGGSGADTLTGGLGADVLTGGEGADLFTVTVEDTGDVITDFSLKLDGEHTSDQLDTSDLRTAEGGPVHSWDVRYEDVGDGNTRLSFPGGESLTLKGVSAKEIAELGGLHRLGVPCFVAGARIACPDGARRIEDLAVGDLVMTENGPRPVLWHGVRYLTRAELDLAPNNLPVRFEAGVIGNRRPMKLSQQHGVALASGHVLIRARHLLHLPGVRVVRPGEGVSYHHLLLDRHSLLNCDGARVESFYPGPQAMAGLALDARQAVLAVLWHLHPERQGLAPEGLYGSRCLPLQTGGKRCNPKATVIPARNQVVLT